MENLHRSNWITLPPEIWREILSKKSPKDLINLSPVCRTLDQITSTMWESKARKKYPMAAFKVKDLAINWKLFFLFLLKNHK